MIIDLTGRAWLEVIVMLSDGVRSQTINPTVKKISPKKDETARIFRLDNRCFNMNHSSCKGFHTEYEIQPKILKAAARFSPSALLTKWS